MTKKMWDQRYAESEYVYGTSPNTFFKLELDKLSPGKILLPAEGEGRNAVYAAEKGWKVWAFDQSEEGRKKALRLAAERHVMITYSLHDLNVPDYPVDFFDVVALVFVHTPSPARQQIHRNLLRFLKPGGKVILIGYSKEQLQFDTGGPRDEAMLFSLEEIKTDFSGTRILFLDQMETLVEEGDYHRGKASVIQLLAEKK
ncbi:MAG: class I SAM-dependent methyltransferase [Bacteroidales bacterium]